MQSWPLDENVVAASEERSASANTERPLLPCIQRMRLGVVRTEPLVDSSTLQHCPIWSSRLRGSMVFSSRLPLILCWSPSLRSLPPFSLSPGLRSCPLLSRYADLLSLWLTLAAHHPARVGPSRTAGYHSFASRVSGWVRERERTGCLALDGVFGLYIRYFNQRG